MPEGPEVALTAEILDHYLSGKRILKAKILSGKYLRQQGYLSQLNKVLPLKIIEINSCGKFMWFKLQGDKYLSSGFGMTGYWTFTEEKNARIKLEFKLITLYFIDARNFGNFCYHSTPEFVNNKIEQLKPDFLKDNFHLDEIIKFKKNITSVLMEQGKVGSGIGNYLVSEILYRAKISPHRLCNTLTKQEIKKLERSIKYVMKLAYQNNHIGYMINIDNKFPNYQPKYEYHPNINVKEKTFSFKVYQQKRDPKDNHVKAERGLVAGRTTYWVPSVQI